MTAAVKTMRSRADRPFCECGHCDSTGRKGGDEVTLPAAAWVVAGHGDLDRLAVAPGHETHWPDADHIQHRGWVEVLPAP